ncbi:PREDICTED: dyslexia-associated protein KIAA0319 homolog isoform X3 [Cyprinodon variegatus]|uniref:dyslexia-associated protein KIAA0319 homolog isoform X3 n=1 Tax=Cyprinodon variegatus TaxID=28743 RepID=UPI00074259B6|nr:PREDICTED: dyslexia-associated protein KIAA0319 homolog isoform X3 [Cyprinodon variegatus]
MWGKTVITLISILEAAVASPCWQGATFPEAVVSPAVESSGIMRVPGVASLQQCVAACCDLPGYDLAWLFKGRCYVLNCQQGANCRPQVRPGADSVLAFLQRSPQSLLLQSLVRGEPYGGSWGSNRDLEPLRGLALFDGPRSSQSDPGMVDVEYTEGSQELRDRLDLEVEPFNRSQEEDPEGAGPKSSGTQTPMMSDGTAGQKEENGTTEPTGPPAPPKTTEMLRVAVLPSWTPAADSAPTDNVTTPYDIISTTGSPGSTMAPPLENAADSSERTGPSEAANTHTSDPLKVLQSSPASSDPLIQDVTSDLSASLPATLPPSEAAATAAELRRSNKAPVAVVGPDRKLDLPLGSLLLDGSGSTDDRGVSSYTWEVVSGPPGLQLQDADRAVAMVTGLRGGRYTFRLTVRDEEGATDSALLLVRIQEARSLPPVAHASGSHVLTLPNNSLVLHGSVSDRDAAEVRFLWTRDSQSPAAGEVLFGSETQPSLYLSDLVEGTYLFQLKVTDAQGRSNSATATVEVRPEPGGGQQVELEMLVSVSQVSVAQRDTVVRQLAALIHVLDRDIRVRALQGRTHLSTVLRFSVEGPSGPLSASSLVVLLRKQLLREKSDFLLFKVLRVDTVVCELSCSGRGQCDPITKQCSCDPFWTENLIRLYLGDGESNCEWRVLYVILSSFLMMVLILSLSWTFICCSRRRKQTKGRKKTRYTILDDMDEQEKLKLRPRFSLKHRSTEHNTCLMMSESELDSDQDSVFSHPVRNRNRVGSRADRNGNAFG